MNNENHCGNASLEKCRRNVKGYNNLPWGSTSLGPNNEYFLNTMQTQKLNVVY